MNLALVSLCFCIAARPPLLMIHLAHMPITYTAKTGGVLGRDSSGMNLRYCSRSGMSLLPVSAKSSRMMHRVQPAGPRFFCAPAYTIAYLVISIGREYMCELVSQMRGTPSGVFGIRNHSVP